MIHSVGINTYMRGKGFDDPVILEFATGLIEQWEILMRHVSIVTSAFLGRFVSAMWECLQGLEPVEVNGLSDDDSRLTIWVEVFKLHYFVRR